jgi:predicted outer membrane repeat protein
LDARFLADAFGYTITLPSNVVVDPDIDPKNSLHTSSAHTTFDSQTGTLLVQGLPQPNNETFTIALDGDEMVVTVAYTGTNIDYVSRFKAGNVSQIVIARNGGNDTLAIDAAFAAFVKEVNYIVSSNQDNANAGTVGDSIVDLSAVIPGNQVALRAAIVDANGTAGGAARAIYVPRGNYRLTLANATESSATNDLDVTGNLTIIGTGAGASVIDASGLQSDGTGANDRIFQLTGAGISLDLSGLTLTGATTAGTGGAMMVQTNAKADLRRVAFVGNTSTGSAPYGGGLRVATATVSVRDSVFTANSAAWGGAIYANGTSVLTIGNTVFAKNTASTQSPNVYVENSGVTRINEGNNLTDSNPAGLLFQFSSTFGDLIDTTTPAASLAVVTMVADVTNAADNAYALSLREAVVAANAAGGTIWLPAWRHRLTLANPEATDIAASDDLDIRHNVTIVGVGAGASVIDAGGLTSNGIQGEDRIFDVLNGNLNMSRMTLTGGHAVNGGAVTVRAGGQLTVTQSAFVNNVATIDGGVTGNGGAIYVAPTATSVSITNSVITANTSVNGGGIRSDKTGVQIGNTIIANNIGNSGSQDVYLGVAGITFTSQGGNRLTTTGNTGTTFTTNPSDYVGAVDYVVTGVTDTFDHADDATVRSVRDAIDTANTTAGIQEIWLPAWKFVLTRQRDTTPGATDIDIAFGDLDIHQSLVLRGVQGPTSFQWRAGIVDAYFDLIGDYNGDGIANGSDNGGVGSEDYTIWADTLGSTTDLRADGDDNGIVAQADWTVWASHYGNTLTHFGV